jgi:hypothetical protein
MSEHVAATIGLALFNLRLKQLAPPMTPDIEQACTKAIRARIEMLPTAVAKNAPIIAKAGLVSAAAVLDALARRSLAAEGMHSVLDESPLFWYRGYCLAVVELSEAAQVAVKNKGLTLRSVPTRVPLLEADMSHWLYLDLRSRYDGMRLLPECAEWDDINRSWPDAPLFPPGALTEQDAETWAVATGLTQPGEMLALLRTDAAAKVTLREDFPEAEGFGFRGLDNTPAGRVVRLGDVVRWLQKSKPCPEGEALALVLDRLTPAHMHALCELDHGLRPMYAKALDAAGRFNCPTQDKLNGAWAKRQQLASGHVSGSRSSWVTMGGELGNTPADRRGFGVHIVVPKPGTPGGPGVAVEAGLPALLASIAKDWKAPFAKNRQGVVNIDAPDVWASRLAIRLNVAHALWSCGQPIAAPAVEVAPTAETPLAAPAGMPAPDEEWTGPKLAALKDDLQRQGVKNFNQVMQSKTGLKEREIRRRINPTPAKRKTATPFDGLATMPRKRGHKAA